MKQNHKIKSLSKITKTLLQEGESERADFKKTPDGVKAEDLTAFANNANGGTILVGVTETTDESGRQIGVVSGCDVSDGAVLQIMNKASSCIPPVGVRVHIENTNAKPILRIDIPESESKPHCTSSGVYCRRDGNRNRPLHPTELLKIFLDNEGRVFAERFEQSADKITNELFSLESSLKSSIDSMSSQLGWADYQLGDTESTLDAVKGIVQYLKLEANKTSSRLGALFEDRTKDPVKMNVKNDFIKTLIDQFSQNPAFVEAFKQGEQLSISNYPKELDETDVKDAVTAAVGKFESLQKNNKSKPIKN